MIICSLSRSLRRALCLSVLLGLLALAAVPPACAGPAATYTKLHDFGKNGAAPQYANLIFDAKGSAYGMTQYGGAFGNGLIFKLKPDGTFYDLHDFAGGSTDGANPQGSLTLSGDGSTLYGMTTQGGASGKGIVFRLPVTGGTLTDLHDFTGSITAPLDGATPYGSLILSGSTLYGMTFAGGAAFGFSNKGIVFSIDTNGNGFTDLHDFTGSTTDGSQPYGSLILSGSTLYGMTSAGGASNTGIMFSLPTTALASTPTALTNLHQFGVTTATTEGAFPQSALVTDGTVGSFPGFYLTTLAGGNTNDGALYDLVTTSTAAATLTKKVDFLASTTGRLPSGLTQNGSTYYSVTEGGNGGYFFTYGQGGTSVTPTSLNGLGTHPLAPPAYIDATHVLFSALDGGPSSQGALLSFNPASPAVSLAGTFTGAANGAYPTGLVPFNATTFYGSTRAGGVNGTGAIYQVTLNAGGYSAPLLVASFDALGSNATGASPQGTLVSDGTSLYGVAVNGGAHGTGTVWKFTPGSPGTLTALYPFTALAGNTEGASPVAGLTLNGTTLYGVASAGGQYGFGAVFKLSMAGSFIRMYSFSGVFGDPTTPFDGQTPAAPLTYTTINGTPTLLGTTSYGGQYGMGTAFSITGF